MQTRQKQTRNPRFSSVFCTCVTVLFLLCHAHRVQAQEDKTPKRGFQPAGSYALGEIETISTTNGNLMLHIPLASLPAGRAGLTHSVRLNYNSKLYDNYTSVGTDPFNMNPVDQNRLAFSGEGGWMYSFGYNLQVIDRTVQYQSTGMPQCPDVAARYRHKVKMRFPDGSLHEFRPAGWFNYQQQDWFEIRADGLVETCMAPQWVTSTLNYYSVDGTYMRLEIQHDSDELPWNNPWTLYLPDGGRITGGNAPNRIYDRNNNYIELQNVADYNQTGHPASLIVDQLGRSLVIEYNNSSSEDYVRVQGFNNQTLTWTVKWNSMWFYKKYLAADSNPYPGYDGPPFIEEIWGFLPIVERVTLPAQAGGLSYTFAYNSNAIWPNQSYGWGEVSSVTLPEGVRPSGATASYQYSRDGHNSPGNYYNAQDVLTNTPVQKDLTYWLEYDGVANQTTDTWLYTINPQGGWTTITQPDGGIVREDFSDLGIHYWSAGLVHKTTPADGSITERLWLQNIPQGMTPPPGYWLNTGVNTFVKTEFVSVKDVAGNPVKTAIKDYNYDKNGNLTQVVEYDWVAYGSIPRDGSGKPTGIPGGLTPKRVTVNTYYNATPDASDTTTDDSDVYHKTTSPQLKRAIESSEARSGFSASTALSRAESFYDNSATTGNLTSQKSWDSTKGAITRPLTTGNSVSVTHQYDTYGNRTLTTDARGYQTQFIYDPINGFSNLYPTQIKTALGASVQRHLTQQYDFYTGLVTQSTDVDNNVTAKTTYDAFGRPTLVEEADGTTVERQTSTQYSDTARRVVVRADLAAAGDGKLVTVQHFDQLGRIRLSRRLENPNDDVMNETLGIKVQTRYFAGTTTYPNVYQLVSNPYRAATSSVAGSEGTMGWSRAKLDKGGRVVEAQTFNAPLPQPWGAGAGSTGAVVTEYDAEFTKVTDQAGKVRRSMIDGLGRLARVDEPDGSGNLGTTASPIQPTSYTYSALDNLTQVNQGAQTRTFVYSSLSRLTSATNPESGATTYQYDNNGNLTSKTDARPVTTTITYDALNRPTLKTYSCNTPSVSYFYDDQSLPSGAPGYSHGFARGRLIAVTYGGGSQGSYYGYDELGRPTIKYQRTGATNYQILASYNRAGAMISETYPSTRMANYSYDNAGRLSAFTGTLGDGLNRTYATVTQYNAAGLKERESYGTEANGMTTPLYLKLQYNRRLQMVDLRLSSINDQTDLNRGALIFYYGMAAAQQGNPFADSPDNNGNLLRQWSYVPNPNGPNPTVTPQLDDYTYDSLNRVAAFTEGQINESGTLVQSVVTQNFSYDRYGNRCVSPGATGGVSTYCPTYTTSNNRISGLTYDAAGSITNDPATGGTMIYDGENRLEMATSGGGGAYTYDGEGKRVKRMLAGGQEWWYVYGIGGELLAEYLSTSPTTVKKEYGYRAGQLLVVWDGDKSGDERLKWLVTDHLGSTRMEADKSGSLAGIRRHDYAPFGEELYAGIRRNGSGQGQYGYEPPQSNVRVRYDGYERDSETGLDFAQARYCSSVQGRFTSADPIFFQKEMPADPQRFNLYSYVRNNPLNLIDPTGEAIELIGDDDQRRRILEALKIAVGKEAADYLYVEPETVDGKTRYFVKVYSNGPDGKGQAFRNINPVAKVVDKIISDTRVAEVRLWDKGATVTKYDGAKVKMGTNLAKGERPAFTDPHSSGGNRVHLLNPASLPSKHKGFVFYPMDVMEGPNLVVGEFSDALIHEFGHVFANWNRMMGVHRGGMSTMAGDFAVALENTSRRLRDPSAPLRVRHNPSPFEPMMTREEAVLNWR